MAFVSCSLDIDGGRQRVVIVIGMPGTWTDMKVQSCSTTNWGFPVEELGGLQFQEKKRSMAFLSRSPFFLKAPLRGKGRAAPCMQGACGARGTQLIEQAGRGLVQVGCGRLPVPE